MRRGSIGTRSAMTCYRSTRPPPKPPPRRGSPSSPRSGAGSTRRSPNCGRTPGLSSCRSWTTTSKSAASFAARMKSSSRCACLGRFFGLPVGDEDLVCPFGLLGEFLLFVASLLVVVGRARDAIVAAAGGCASGELEFALFVRHQTGPRERVVLAFGHQVPREDGQFAGGRDDGGLEAAAGLESMSSLLCKAVGFGHR